MKCTVITVCINGSTRCLAISGELPNPAQLIVNGNRLEQMIKQFDVIACGSSPKAIASRLGVSERDLQVIRLE